MKYEQDWKENPFTEQEFVANVNLSGYTFLALVICLALKICNWSLPVHGAAVSPFLPMQWRAELSPKAHLYCLLKFNASLKNRDLHMTRPFSREPRLKTSLRWTQDTASNYHHLWLCAFVWKLPIVLTSSPLVTRNLYYATNLHQCSWQLRCFKLPWARDQWNFLSW